MKKILLIALVLFSCGQRKGDEAPEKGFGGTVSLIANGKPEKFSKNVFEVGDEIFVLKSYSGDSLRIELGLADGIANTSYHIVDTLANGFMYFPSDGTTNFSPHFDADVPTGNNRGTLQITDIDEKNETLSGTFSAQLARGSSPDMKIGDSTNMTITHGAFTHVPYKIKAAPAGTMQVAKVDGQDFKGNVTANDWSAYLEFIFLDQNRQLGFRISEDIAVGKYSVSDFKIDNVFASIWYIDGIHSFKGSSGTITITELTPHKHIKGTFSIEVESYPVPGKTKSITEGSFDITFPVQ